MHHRERAKWLQIRLGYVNDLIREVQFFGWISFSIYKNSSCESSLWAFSNLAKAVVFTLHKRPRALGHRHRPRLVNLSATPPLELGARWNLRSWYRICLVKVGNGFSERCVGSLGSGCLGGEGLETSKGDVMRCRLCNVIPYQCGWDLPQTVSQLDNAVVRKWHSHHFWQGTEKRDERLVRCP